jgi:hypothetical protein
MSNFPEKLRLKALAEEDIYFAKRDRELIKALHERKLAKHLKLEEKKKKKKAKVLEDKYAAATVENRHKLKKLGQCYRSLIDRALQLIKRKRR